MLFEPVPEEKAPAEKAKLPSGQGKLEDVLKKTVVVLDRRLNPGAFGPLFHAIKVEAIQGGRIQVTVPSTDPKEVARVERVVLESGVLEFRVLATDLRTHSPNQKAFIEAAKALPPDQTQLWEAKKGDEPARLLAWWVPVWEGKEDELRRDTHLGTREITDRSGKKRLEVLVVKDDQDVTGEYLIRAAASKDEQGRPCVTFQFNSTGGAKFGRLTTFYSPDRVQNFEYHLGIILDKKLFTAPNLKSTISDRGQISGDFNEARVKELVDVLNAGPLPVLLRKVSP